MTWSRDAAGGAKRRSGRETSRQHVRGNDRLHSRSNGHRWKTLDQAQDIRRSRTQVACQPALARPQAVPGPRELVLCQLSRPGTASWRSMR
jgi:hypothetical protein